MIGLGEVLVISLTLFIFLTALLIQRKIDKKRFRDAVSCADEIIRNYSKEFTREYFRAVTYDRIGAPIYTNWEKSVRNFFVRHLAPLLPTGNQALFRKICIEKINKSVDHAYSNPVKDFKQQFADFKPNMSGYDFEKYCMLLLNSSGWKARLTAGSGDQGADIIGTKDGKTTVFQCKLYSRPVNNSAVQEVAAAKNHYVADYAAVISKSGYTPSARQLARSNKVALLSIQELEESRDLRTKLSAQPQYDEELALQSA